MTDWICRASPAELWIAAVIIIVFGIFCLMLFLVTPSTSSDLLHADHEALKQAMAKEEPVDSRRLVKEMKKIDDELDRAREQVRRQSEIAKERESKRWDAARALVEPRHEANIQSDIRDRNIARAGAYVPFWLVFYPAGKYLCWKGGEAPLCHAESAKLVSPGSEPKIRQRFGMASLMDMCQACPACPATIELTMASGTKHRVAVNRHAAEATLGMLQRLTKGEL
jgi:hypothetical protein